MTPQCQTRTGKIARLPKAVREQLNRRLQDGEPGKRLVEWLNTLPEVQEVLRADFGGRPISEQNLSEWKAGGYREWLLQQEALDMVKRVAADADELQQATTEPLTDKLAPWLVARYFVAAKALATGNGEVDWRLLRELCNDVVALRRGDHYAARLRLERERLDQEKDWSEEELIEHFGRWAQNPDVRDCICGTWVNPEERKRRLRAILGVVPGETAPSTQAATPESNPIKPDQTQSNQDEPGEAAHDAPTK